MTRQQLLNTKGINNVITFGRYKGKTILQVLYEKPTYLIWCIKNVQGFKIDETLKKDLLHQYHIFENDRCRETRYMMKKYGMHASEAISYIENEEEFEHY